MSKKKSHMRPVVETKYAMLEKAMTHNANVEALQVIAQADLSTMTNDELLSLGETIAKVQATDDMSPEEPWTAPLSVKLNGSDECPEMLVTGQDDELQDKEKQSLYADEEPESSEDFFFKDFSNLQGKKPRRPMSKAQRRSARPPAKLNLASFARELHNNRLSVMHPRQSRIHITEEDEAELARILYNAKALASTQSLAIPIVSQDSITPSLFPDPVSPSQPDEVVTASSPVQEPVPDIPDVPDVPDQPSIPQLDLSIEQQPTDEDASKGMTYQESTEDDNELTVDTLRGPSMTTTATVESLSPPSPATPTSPSEHSDMYSMSPSIKTVTRTRSAESYRRDSTPLLSPASSLSTPKERKASGVVIKRVGSPVGRTDRAEALGWKLSVRRSGRISNVQNGKLVMESTTSPPSRTPSTSSTLYKPASASPLLMTPTKKSKANATPTSSTSTSTTTTTTTSTTQEPSQADDKRKEVKLGLFGSLRNATQRGGGRAGSSGFRGLMRSLSSAGAAYRHSRNDPDKSTSDSPLSNQTMSPAAKAVLEHNARLHKDLPNAPFKKEKITQAESVTKAPVTHSNGIRLVSQLLARSSKSRRSTKTVNLLDESTSRKQIVRRTIIYVQPDSLNFLKQKDAPPPVPQRPSLVATNRRSTKASNRRHDVDSLTKASLDFSEISNSQRLAVNQEDEGGDRSKDYLEGLELREMSDGSVVWGIVKQQGNRKSFFAPTSFQSSGQGNDQKNHDNAHQPFRVEEEVDDSETGVRQVLALMEQDSTHRRAPSRLTPSNNFGAAADAPPPIPRRSPRRPVAADREEDQTRFVSSTSRNKTTMDIYYAPDVTLPNLLKMVASGNHVDDDFLNDANSDQGRDILQNNLSVEEQLDALMQSFATHA